MVGSNFMAVLGHYLLGLDGIQEVVLAILPLIASEQPDSDSLPQLIEPSHAATMISDLAKCVVPRLITEPGQQCALGGIVI